MSFLIDNIYHYLQVDVLESQWIKLNDGIKASRDFEECRMLHDQYQDSILEQCFLNLPDVLKALQDVLLMCTKLCKLLKTVEENDVKNEAFKEAFWQIKHNFEKQSNRVFNLLSNFKDNH